MEKPSEQEPLHVIEFRKLTPRVTEFIDNKLFQDIYPHLYVGTWFEVEGLLNPKGIEDNESLRRELKILVKNLNIDKDFTPEDWILAGIVDKETIPDDKFQQCLKENQDEDFQKIVRYFIGEREKNNQ